MKPEEIIQYYLANPDELIKKKPFTRGMHSVSDRFGSEGTALVGEEVSAVLPDYEKVIVSQETFVKELDPRCHKVLFDENIPSITVKTKDRGYVEVESKRMGIALQKAIRNKHVEFLCGYPIQHTLSTSTPSKIEQEDFAIYKRMWKSRNQDGMRTRMVWTQKSYGDAGLLFYFDRNGEIKSRVISYEDGYIICSHNDSNGDRLIESVYYRKGDREYIDSYTDTMQYRHVKSHSPEDAGETWKLESAEKHGFEEIPLVTKRGNVAWDAVQDIIEVYEILFNVFIVIQKRHGWGILYIKGNFSENAKRIAGSVILNDTSMNKDGSAQYLTPPTPQGMLDTLNLLLEEIQRGSGTTFILPKDVKTGGDISGVAIQLTQSLDNEEALYGVIDWQNVANKASRLFKYGVAKELVKKGDKDAITRFSALDIQSSFKPWRPRNDYEYNQMLTVLKGAGLISTKTGIEKNTESTPDEELRVLNEASSTPVETVEVFETNTNNA